MIDDPAHHAWLAAEGERLLGFYRGAADRRAGSAGGFSWLDDRGARSAGEPTYLWVTTRKVHCFALAHLLGDPTAAELVDHGLAALALDGALRDPVHGGWYWSAGPAGAVDDHKQAYGHAFVVLAGASAQLAGRPGAQALLTDALAVVDQWFWRPGERLCVDSYRRDWTGPDPYRGANANMHMVEAFLAASEATGDSRYAGRAAAIATRLVHELTAGNGWRMPEHYDQHWRALLDYHADAVRNPFRPYGSTIGHWLEWTRLLLQLHATAGTRAGWMREAAVTLFDKAVAEGWDRRRGGFVYTVDWHGRPVVADRLHWVLTEAIGAAVALYRTTGDPRYDRWYGRFWEHARQWFIDDEHGSWVPQRDQQRQRVTDPWHGKPDLYHAFQATLFARIPFGGGLAATLVRAAQER